MTKEGWHFFSLASTGFSILNLIAVETLFTSENLTGLRYDLCRQNLQGLAHRGTKGCNEKRDHPKRPTAALLFKKRQFDLAQKQCLKLFCRYLFKIM
ncbi:hypothetical protein [Pedobacter ureilyticus]|uniref:Secreted protein n=1 Tax=Pedobacter ureilyticus TaxID=1393051 RepID=A0ABW9J6B5_9SPHI|nr:hypothetical protein [Pedobacter helvus]